MILSVTVAGAVIVKKIVLDSEAAVFIVFVLAATLAIVRLFKVMEAVAVALFPAASLAVTVMPLAPAANPVIVQLQVVAVG
jgi:hypothetical protein